MSKKDFKSNYNDYMKNIKPSQELIQKTIQLAHQQQESMQKEKQKKTLNFLYSVNFKRYSALACTLIFAIFAVKLWSDLSDEEVPTYPTTTETTSLTTTLDTINDTNDTYNNTYFGSSSKNNDITTSTFVNDYTTDTSNTILDYESETIPISNENSMITYPPSYDTSTNYTQDIYTNTNNSHESVVTTVPNDTNSEYVDSDRNPTNTPDNTNIDNSISNTTPNENNVTTTSSTSTFTTTKMTTTSTLNSTTTFDNNYEDGNVNISIHETGGGNSTIITNNGNGDACVDVTVNGGDDNSVDTNETTIDIDSDIPTIDAPTTTTNEPIDETIPAATTTVEETTSMIQITTTVEETISITQTEEEEEETTSMEEVRPGEKPNPVTYIAIRVTLINSSSGFYDNGTIYNDRIREYLSFGNDLVYIRNLNKTSNGNLNCIMVFDYSNSSSFSINDLNNEYSFISKDDEFNENNSNILFEYVECFPILDLNDNGVNIDIDIEDQKSLMDLLTIDD